MSSRKAVVALSALAGLALAGCGAGGSSGPAGIQGIALQSGDVPAGFHHCSNFSGKYESIFPQFLGSGADQKSWDAATNAGALDAWIEVYSEAENTCSVYATATNPAPGGTLGGFQNMVFKYRDEASAHKAFLAGAFIPPVPASHLSGRSQPLTGRAIRGKDTGLGVNSYVNIGTLLTYSFWQGAWQNGNYIATIYAQQVPNSAVDTAASQVNSRIPPPSAPPSPAATASH